MILSFSCEKIKRKGHKAMNMTKGKVIETKQKIIHKKNQLVDGVFPKFDSGKPDTENNKKRFSEYLQTELTNDVKNIYTYGDFLGADFKVLISFTCDTTTFNRIVKSNNMKLENELNDGLSFGEEFSWWRKEKIEKIKPYKEGKDAEYWKYLWFDEKSKIAYYEEFSL